MMNTILRQPHAIALGVCISAGAWAAGDGMDLKTETDRTSYALGYQIGGDFKQQQLDLNDVAVVKGIADARTGAASLMSEDAMRASLIELKRKVVAHERAAPLQIDKNGESRETAKPDAQKSGSGSETAAPHAAAKATESASEFLDKNALEKGMVTLPSGLQYKVLKDGAGKQPQAADKVALIYRGALLNGNVFGSSYQDGKAGPKTFPLASLVPGLREAVSHMKEGSKWEVFVPPQLGFNVRTPLYRKVTVFDVELVAVNP